MTLTRTRTTFFCGSCNMKPTTPPPTAFMRIVEDLAAQITRGEIAPGEPLPSYTELARRYGVSMITVSRAANELKSRGLAESRRRVGLFALTPPPPALTGTRQLAAILPDVTNPFIAMMMRGLLEEAGRRDYRVTVMDSGRESEREGDIAEDLLRGGCAGAIVVSIGPSAAPTPPLARLAAAGVPLVYANYIADETVDCVYCDDFKSKFLATRHLLDLGRRRLAYVASDWPAMEYYSRRGLEGFRAALAAGGLDPDEAGLILQAEPGEERPLAALAARLLALRGQFDGLVVFNDLMAMGLMSELLNAGVAIPEELALIGQCDFDFAALTPVPLSSIYQQEEKIGRLTLGLLCEKLAGRAGVRREEIEPILVARASTLGPRPVAAAPLTGEKA